MAYSFDKVSILLVEDNLPMLDLARSLLESFGVGRVYSAHHGKEGFDIFCQENPDLVIADWMMKPVDGISLARRIRSDVASPNPFVPIILMTGFSEERRVVEARDAGITEFLVKPFNVRDLYRRISQIVERPRKFIRADEFFGPDRRRKALQEYEGPLRRSTDVREEDYLVTTREDSPLGAHLDLEGARE